VSRERVEHMKEIGNSQPPTADPSKKKKRRRTSTHYTDKKRNRVRTQKTQARKAPIEGRGTPEDLSESIKDLRKPSWRLDCEIRPFHLLPIVEEAEGSKAQSMAEVEEMANDSIQEDSREETNSTSAVRILGFSKYSFVLADNDKGRHYSTVKLLSFKQDLGCYRCYKHWNVGKYRGMVKVEIVEISTKKRMRR
jgi:hypothetical protein